MKKIKLLKTLLIPTIWITAIGTITAVSTSCSSSVVPVTGVSLDKESLPLGIGDSYTLIATVLPENVTDKSVNWTSSDSTVANVDNNGKVTAVSEGQTTITVTTNDGGFTDTCQVTVYQEIIHVIGVSLDKESLALGIGESDILIATVHPENATDKSVTWSSSNNNVATVDNNGKVTAVSEGQTTIAVTTNDGGFSTDCTVNVINISHICVVTANADSTLELINKGENNPDLQYSTDGVNWPTYSEPINITQDHNIYLKGNNRNGWSQSYGIYSTLSITGDVSISGSVMGLLDNGAEPGEEGDIATSIPCDYCFSRLFDGSTGVTSVSQDFLPANTLKPNCYNFMFSGCTSLTTAPALPATTLAESCYYSMFTNCTSLTTVPDLSATTLAKDCYSYMFDGCTSLTTTPALPATTLTNSCYSNMFNGCTSLTIAPDLPAMGLAEWCYYSMFKDCTSLTTAPDLPAIILANNCYANMFQGCTSLTSAPILRATTLANSCYYGMFTNCTSLTTAPDLPATELATACYEYMFDGCKALILAPSSLPATTLATHCYEKMFIGCTSLTSAPKILPATNLVGYCYYDMFKNCTSLTQVPTLPASKLAVHCYAYMFYGCTSLTTAPDLPATKLATYCYEHMFCRCNSLKSIRIGYVGKKDAAPSNAFDNWVDGVNTTGTFYYKGSDTLVNFGFPSGWIIQHY